MGCRNLQDILQYQIARKRASRLFQNIENYNPDTCNFDAPLLIWYLIIDWLLLHERRAISGVVLAACDDPGIALLPRRLILARVLRVAPRSLLVSVILIMLTNSIFSG